MRLAFSSVLVAGVLLAGELPGTNPARTATAGAYFTRVKGNHALGINPANLGYYGKPLMLGRTEEAIISDGAGAAQDYYSVQLIASPDNKLVKSTKQVFHRQFGTAFPSAIIMVDSLYKFRVGDFTDQKKAEILRDSLVAYGYSDAWIVREDHPLVELDPVPYFSMTLAGISLNARNNAIHPNWINQQLFGGLDLRDPGKKDEFLSVFPSHVWNMNFMAAMTSLSFTVGNFGMSIVEPKVVSTMNLPTAVIDVLFRGVKFDQPRDLSNIKMDLLGVAPVAVAYGRQLALPQLTKMVDRFFAGAGVNILLGLADMHLVSEQLDIRTTPDSIMIEGRTRVVANDDPESSRSPVLGGGLSLDLGIAMDINPALSASLALKDLFGRITWPDRCTTVNEFSIHLSGEDIEDIAEDYSNQLDSLKQRFSESDTSYASGTGRTVYPSQFILGASYRVLPELTIDASLIHYLNNDYLEDATPQLSLGIEYAPASVFPMYAGIGLGGMDGFKWGAGFALNLGAFQWNLGFGQNGGVLNAARGVSISTEFRLLLGPPGPAR
ncbi:MAG: SPOR domain-containing protein [Fidelibacterota bacterium]|nr:MAG: SPOR domain-containing protein [Candidatus Neomarinimicrobiota bacterium]